MPLQPSWPNIQRTGCLTALVISQQIIERLLAAIDAGVRVTGEVHRAVMRWVVRAAAAGVAVGVRSRAGECTTVVAACRRRVIRRVGIVGRIEAVPALLLLLLLWGIVGGLLVGVAAVALLVLLMRLLRRLLPLSRLLLRLLRMLAV